MGHAELEPDVRYDMPPGFGPSVSPDVESDFGLDGSTVELETTPEALAPLLPKWFRPTPRLALRLRRRHLTRTAACNGRPNRLAALSCGRTRGTPWAARCFATRHVAWTI